MKLKFINHDHGEVVIGQGALSIGSGPGNDVQLDAEGIADKHARFTRDGGTLHVRAVEDADVFVNGRRIRERTRVRYGDVVGLHRVQARIAGDGGGEDAEGVSAVAGTPSTPVPETRVRPALASWYLRGVSGETFGRLFPVEGRMVIGRGKDCDIVLEVGEVSRRHASLEVAADGLEIRDLDSSNGTYINGERIRKATLGRGDEVAFDTLRFRLETSPGRQASPPPKPTAGKPGTKAGAETADRGAGTWIAIAAGVIVVLAAAAWWVGLI